MNLEMLVTTDLTSPEKTMADHSPMPPPDDAALRAAFAFDLSTFFPYLVRIYYRAVSGAVSDLYTTRHGLSVWQWRTMAVLGIHRGLSASEIVEQSSMDKVNVSRAVKSLRQSGLLKRDIDGEDRRRAVLRLTDAGSAIFTDLVPRMLKVEAALLDGLTEDERRTLTHVMAKVRRNAEAIRSGAQSSAGITDI